MKSRPIADLPSTYFRCGGVMLCTAGELNFHALGFAAVVASTLLRGVKSILQAIRIIMMTAIPCEAPFPTRLLNRRRADY